MKQLTKHRLTMTLAFLAALTCGKKQDIVKEVVLYQLKADSVMEYKAIAETTNQFLQRQKGFIQRKILQDKKDPTLFVDIVEWETIEDAESAIQISQKEPSLRSFFEATEKVTSFSHYTEFK